MTTAKKVKYLKIDRGQYYYQRRVPDQFQELLDLTRWQIPCGDVSYAKAVQLVVNWAEEHDDLLKRLKTPQGYDAVEAEILRDEAQISKAIMESEGGTRMVVDGEKVVPIDELEKPWMVALTEVAKLDEYHAAPKAPEYQVLQLKAKIASARREGVQLGKVKLTAYPEFVDLAQQHLSESDLVEFEFSSEPPRAMSDERYLDRLREIYDLYFSADLNAPSTPD